MSHLTFKQPMKYLVIMSVFSFTNKILKVWKNVVKDSLIVWYVQSHFRLSSQRYSCTLIPCHDNHKLMNLPLTPTVSHEVPVCIIGITFTQFAALWHHSWYLQV